jgi:predicted nucleic acid-binding protein
VTFRNAALADLALLDIATDPDTDTHGWTTTLQLADRFRLTLYDAAYLELAHRHSLPLATLDEVLRAAGRALNLPLLGGSHDSE